MSSAAPTVEVGKRRNGVAGEYIYVATVTYPDEKPEHVTFQSSVYGPPIVMVTDVLADGVFVSERVLERIGSDLTPEWIHAFFAPRDES